LKTFDEIAAGLIMIAIIAVVLGSKQTAQLITNIGDLIKTLVGNIVGEQASVSRPGRSTASPG
jgi:hypothetical protein